MAPIAGQYVLVENKNFLELMLKLGIPEEDAKKANDAKGTLGIEVNGSNIKLLGDANLKSYVSELVLDKEVDEKFPTGEVYKSTSTLDGTVLTINAKADKGTVKRVMTFSETGLEMRIIINQGNVNAEATRIYKRA